MALGRAALNARRVTRPRRFAIEERWTMVSGRSGSDIVRKADRACHNIAQAIAPSA
jgi:hypothetical protein